MSDRELDQPLLSPRLCHRALDVSTNLSPMSVETEIIYTSSVITAAVFDGTLSHAIAAPSRMKQSSLEKATRRPSLSSQNLGGSRNLLPKEVVTEPVVGAGGGTRAPRPAKWRRARRPGSRSIRSNSSMKRLYSSCCNVASDPKKRLYRAELLIELRAISG